MNFLIIWWIFGLVLLLKVEALDGACVKDSEVICECFNSSKTTHSIECCDDEIIQLERPDQEILYKLSDANCRRSTSNSSTCLTSNQNPLRLYHEHKVNMYNSCSGKKRCNITVIQSQNIRIQIPMVCVPESDIYNTQHSLPSTSSIRYQIFYIADKDFSGKKIRYSCTAQAKKLYLEVFYINLGPESCGKVKMYSKGLPTFGLGCTDTGLTTFYKNIAFIGTEFSLEMEDLKLEKNEVIYLRISANKRIVNCNGSQNEIPGIPSTPSTTENNDLSTAGTENFMITSSLTTTSNSITENKELSTGDTENSKISSSLTTISDSTTENKELSTGGTENSKMADEEGDEINPHALYGGIIAALIVITIICIGVYCFIRNRKKQKEATTNVAMSNRKETNSDNSHYNYVDITNAQVTNSSNDNREHIPVKHGATSPQMKSELKPNQISKTKSAKENPSDYDHIFGDKSLSRDVTPVYNRDNYDHIKSTSLQGVMNNPYNHIGDNIQDSDHNRIIAKGHKPSATKSDGSNEVEDTYNHLKK